MEEMNLFSNNTNNTAAFGIDLGTTNSAISVVAHGNNAETITLSSEKKTMPSCVIWEDGKFIVGDYAYDNRYKKNAVYSVKRKMQDPSARIKVDCDGIIKEFKPAEISAEVLRGLVEQAGNFYGEIKDVTITVPAYFDQNGISSTEEAAKLAGLNLLSIIREPTAASLTYQQATLKETKEFAVFDLGGGTLDVSVIKLVVNTKQDTDLLEDLYGFASETSTDSNQVVVLGIDGDSNLGGDDVDRELLEVLKRRLKASNPTFIELPNEEEEKLLLRVEYIKKRTSDVASYQFTYDGSVIVVTTEMVREAYLPTFKKCSKIFSKVIKEVNTSIKTVFLVGGSTKSEVFKNMLRAEYPEYDFIDALNPDEAVSNGAAIKAHADKFDNKMVQVFDIIPIGIGVKDNGSLQTLIKKGSQLPVLKRKLFTTMYDNQEEIEIEILQGNTRFLPDSISLGTLLVDGLPKGPAGSVDIYISISINANNLLTCECSINNAINRKLELDLRGISSNKSMINKEERFISRWKTAASRMSTEAGGVLLGMIDKYVEGYISKEVIVEYIRENS